MHYCVISFCPLGLSSGLPKIHFVETNMHQKTCVNTYFVRKIPPYEREYEMLNCFAMWKLIGRVALNYSMACIADLELLPYCIDDNYLRHLACTVLDPCCSI